MPIFDVTGGGRIELGEDRGDLRYTSGPFGSWDGGPFWNGLPISYARLFADQPWVAIAVMRLLTWAIRVPLKLYRQTDEDGAREHLRPGQHPLATALASPWDRGSQAQLVGALMGPLCVHGNALVDVDQGARGALRFDPIPWQQSLPIRQDPSDPFEQIVGWKVVKPSQTYERSADSMMHLSWWSPLGTTGISPLQQLHTTLESEGAAIEWALRNLKAGVRPNALIEFASEVLEMDPNKRQDFYDRTVETIKDKYGGEVNAGKVPVIPPGLKWVTAQHTTAVEAQLVAQRHVNRVEVAAIFMIPPPMIGQLERSTFNNITTLRELAYTDGLAPPLVLIEQTINAHVVRGLLAESDLFVEFDLGAILRGDRLKEIEALRGAISSGLLTPNEGRKVLNEPRVNDELMDAPWMPTNNLAPVKDGAQAPAPAGRKRSSAPSPQNGDGGDGGASQNGNEPAPTGASGGH